MKRAIRTTMVVLHFVIACFGFMAILEAIHYYNKASTLKDNAIALYDTETESGRYMRTLEAADGRGLAAIFAATATASFALSSLLLTWSRSLRPSQHTE